MIIKRYVKFHDLKGCDATRFLTFWKNILPPSSELKDKYAASGVNCLLGPLCFSPEDGSSTFLKKSVNMYQDAPSHIPEDSILQSTASYIHVH
jgi:hypothetical protein